MFERILCPLDFSEQSLGMLDCMLELKQLGTKEIILCHVAPANQSVLVSEQKAKMVRLVDTLSASGIKAVEIIEKGSPVEDVLLKVADREKVDLIALASSGKGRAREFFIGSTSFAVLRSSRWPVLVNRFEVHEKGGQKDVVQACRSIFRKALVPIDFTSCTDTCMELIPRLSMLGLRETVLFHVVEGSAANLDNNERFKRVVDTAQTKLEVLRGKLEEKGCNASTHLHFGTVSYNILEASRELDVSVIILGAHRKSLLREVTLGGNSEAVVRKAQMPLLIIPCQK
jgi:nucleotide-binding universal stress UspA family protein